MKKIIYMLGSSIASLALIVSVSASTQTCTFVIGQPKLPDSVKSLRKF